MSLHDYIMRPKTLWDYVMHRKLLGGGSETVIATDYTPYLYRSAPSFGQPYNRQRPVVVGGSVAWNQLVDVGATSVTVPSGHKYYANINGAKTIGSSSGSAISINDGSADNVIDLTALFGSAVADAIYAMEQATAGSGVAFFKSLFGEDYYAYNAGELMSVQTSAHRIYDAGAQSMSEYPLDPNLVLRGVPKWENGGLRYDGDRYLPNGTVERKYAEVDLGTLDWSLDSSGTVFLAFVSAKVHATTSRVDDLMCAKYVCISDGRAASSTPDKTIFGIADTGGVPRIGVKDSAYTDPTAFKAAMNGVMLVYEKATATTESADPYTALQVADPNGTEEWVTSGIVPVGQETEYIKK